MESGDDGFRAVVLGRNYGSNSTEPSTSYSTPIGSSNIGFQLLKKHGWKEGTGLGASEQGRLEPIEAHMKINKRGLGAEKVKKVKKTSEDLENHTDEQSEKTGGNSTRSASPNHSLLPELFDNCPCKLVKKKSKGMSKKMRKMQEFEKRLEEREFDRAFFRLFWPDNV